ncbi:RusA family crossover junction endodeoxyribonuclease [Variovorax sp. CAN2819]|uniref:RusA family crossover junction endodeoxyribonuclease n=1 Tax=Variovorax sp. CAN15 TaxID=3046727 RepID=UPI00264A1A1B|nr:RusA family crossover junction endodeoxyribonuclease [Variovorax sp. CAN15]MDN6885308.1 RusA family crossover junction endodeoxyribonuclease [Variovorax sp. CAN15]
MLHFHVPGQPVGKGRPRIGKVGAHARMFTPEKTVNYEGLVALAAQQAMAGAALLEGACEVKLRIDCQIPASWSQKKQRAAAAGEIRPTTKPDADNVIKAIFDAMNGVVWKDDVQAVELAVSKRYSMVPGVAVRVELLDPAPPAQEQGDLLGATA